METIKNNSNLFKIITPKDVNQFQNLLQSHLNCPFVNSVCQGPCEAFCPWADTHYKLYPCIVDELLGMPQNAEEAEFLWVQQDHERLKERFLGLFERDLLPGMHALSIHAMPKPHSEELCMVINQSARPCSPNGIIKHKDIKDFPLDNMKHLGTGLLACHWADPNQSFQLFKLDVAEAYLLLSMHSIRKTQNHLIALNCTYSS
jgi:hypothetical protein